MPASRRKLASIRAAALHVFQRISNWIGERLGAEGLPIKWKIFGIAILGGALTTLIMGVALWSIGRVQRADDADNEVAATLNQINEAHTSFVDVRTELFRLASQPELDASVVDQATRTLDAQSGALDATTLPEGERRNVAALKVGLVTYAESARDFAERLGPSFAGPLELADYDKRSEPLEGLFDHATSDAVDALEASRSSGRGLLTTVRIIVVGTALLGLGLLLAMSLRLTLIIVREFASLAEMTHEVRRGNLSARTGIDSHDELGVLARGLDEMAESIASNAIHRETAHKRELFRNGLVDALEMIDNEYAAARVIQRALAELVPEESAELLLADSSRAHLRRVARNPLVPPPDCQVGTPFDCAAVRKARTLVFDSSTALSACPVLAERGGTPCSAVCAPVSFMGESLGVIHIVSAHNAPLGEAAVKQVETLAGQAGTRIGTLRAFSQTHLQATTDGLTGILNRRSFEEGARKLIGERATFALVMADLDHFKNLNDKFGHESGDRALRLFARVLQETVRTEDIVARFGGEEFVLALTRTDEVQAVKLLERIQFALAGSIAQASVPVFTASFGIARCDEATGSLEDALRSADGALYAAKASGRNRIVVAGELTPAIHGEGVAEQAIGDVLDAL